MIIDRYIIRGIARPMLLGCSLLIVVFVAYSTAVRLAEVSGGTLQISMVLQLILLSTLISLEVLLPTALYLSIVSMLGRLYRDSEMAALRAAGIGEARILGSVSLFAVTVALLVGIISVFGRPWAYQQSYQLEAKAVAEFDINNMEARRFMEFDNNKYVLYTSEIDQEAGLLKGVFLQRDKEGRSALIVAREAHLPPVEFGKSRSVIFYDGYAYDLDLKNRQDKTLRFGTLTVQLEDDELSVGYKRKSQPTHVLAQSEQPKDIAEFQWRLSTPVATLLLAMLAVPLSRGAPRQGNHRNFFIAILVYVGFFNLMSMARNWVEHGVIAATPGIWWVYIVALLILFLIMVWPTLLLKRQRG